MKDNTYHVKCFGGLEISYEGKTVDLVETLGKQMVNLFEMFVLDKDFFVSKQQLLDELWGDTKNQYSALKFGIFNLRQLLNEMDIFEGNEVIWTVKGGYCLNPELNWKVDVVDFIKVYKPYRKKEIRDEKDFKMLRRMFKLYKAPLYISPSNFEWFQHKRFEYRYMYENAMMKIARYLYSQERYDELIEFMHKSIQIEPLSTGLHFYYMRAIVATENQKEIQLCKHTCETILELEKNSELRLAVEQLYNVLSKNSVEE